MDPGEYAAMDALEERMWWYRALHARLLDAVRGTPLGRTGGRLLDAGCGTGGLLALLHAAEPALDCVGVEWSQDAAGRAARKARVPVVRASVGALPFAAGCFDAVVSADVLCHAAVEPAPALAEMARVLRPGGLLLVNMPAYGWLHAAHDRHVHNARRITAGGLRAWLSQAGFTGLRVGYWNGVLFPLMVVQRKLLGRRAAGSDVAPLPGWLDATFHAVAAAERRSRLRLGFGGSVMALARRP